MVLGGDGMEAKSFPSASQMEFFTECINGFISPRTADAHLAKVSCVR
jgi:hypothetical protein